MLDTPLQSKNQTTVDAVKAQDFSCTKEGKGGGLSSESDGFRISIFWDAKGILMINYLQKAALSIKSMMPIY